MRRRDFLSVLGGAVAAWPVVAHAQQVRRLPRVGILMANSKETGAALLDAVQGRLTDLGRVHGQTAIIDVVWGDGRMDRLPALAAELVAHKPDVVFAPTTAGIIAMKRVAPDLPMVFATATDPIGSGFVQSYARPGGNITGVQGNSDTLPGKQIDLLREILPAIQRIGMLVNAANPATIIQRRNAEAITATLGIKLLPVEFNSPEEIEPSFQKFLDQHAEAVLIPTDATTLTERAKVARLAQMARLPSIFPYLEQVRDGGLLSYGFDLAENYRRSADLIDKILKGAKPSDIPVEFPTKLYLGINLGTAKKLGLDVPLFLQQRADELVE